MKISWPRVAANEAWLSPYAISGAILDVAFAEEQPPITVNLVHPRPIPWRTSIAYCRYHV
jgi:hypothetical protein